MWMTGDGRGRGARAALAMLLGLFAFASAAAAQEPPQPQSGDPVLQLLQGIDAGAKPGAAPAEQTAPGAPPSDDGGAAAGETGGADAGAADASGTGAGAADAAAAPDAGEAGAEGDAAAPQDVPPEPLRFAVLAGRSVTATLTVVGPMADQLRAALGRPVEILPMTSYDAMVDAQVQRRIDGGFYSAAAYAFAESRCRCLEPVVAPRASDGTLAYHALIVVPQGSPVRSLADLKGKTVAVGPADSIAARRMQLAGLMSDGFDPATLFGAVVDVGSADAAVRLALAGGADAAFAWSSLAGDAASGYSRGTLHDLVASGAIGSDALAIVWRSPPISHGPFAMLRSIPEPDKARVAAYLVGLSDSDPDAYDMLEPLYAGGFAAVDRSDYAGLAILATEDVDRIRLPLVPAETGSAGERADAAAQ